LKELKAIVFDLDDTLYLERDFVKSGFNAVSKWLTINHQLDGDNVFDSLWNMFLDGHRGDLFDSLLDSLVVSDISVDDLIAVYRQHLPNIDPLRGVVPLLDRLKNSNKLGLLSDGYLEVQKKKLDALGIEKYFDSVLFTDELGRDYWKPNVVPFEKILNRLNVNPNESVYIADNPEKDFKGPNQLGMDTIRIRIKGGEHYNKNPQANEYFPMQTVYSIKQLSKEIGKTI
jgi:putative hydrolase of the HAD superfamily